jgi:hypothetical protein
MAKTLMIELSEELERKLETRAIQQSKKIEELVVEWIAKQVDPVSISVPDPIAPLVGTISFKLADLAEHHDEYLGSAFYEELKRDK